MTFTKRRKLWCARVSEYKSSGLSIHEWCKRAGIRVDNLRYWLRKFDESECGQSWAGVKLIDDVKPGAMNFGRTALVDGGVTVRIGAAMIEIQSGFDPMHLTEVLRVVSSIC